MKILSQKLFSVFKIKNNFKQFYYNLNNLTPRTFFIILLAGLSAETFAQPESLTGGQSQPLTLQQAVKTGLENSKNLKLTKAKVDIANAKYYEAVDATIPSLKVAGNYTRFSDVPEFKAQFPGSPEPVTFYPNIPNTYAAKASLSEVVFSGFRLKYAKTSYRLLQQAVALDAQKDSDEVVYTIINAYYNIYKIKKSQEIIVDNLAQMKTHIEETANLEKNGLATHNEVLRWELQEANVELTQLDLQSNMDVANYNLDLMLGLKEDTKIEIDSASLFASRELKSLPDYIHDAEVKRGDLVALEARKKSAENSLRISENSYYPIISVGANAYDERPNARYFPLQDKFNSGWDAGVTLTWDITNLYSNRHNVAESKANLDQSEAQTEVLTDAIKSEVNQNYLSYLESTKRLEVMEKAISSAEENYRITNNKYLNQLALQSELLDADAALLQSRINLALAKADAELAYYKLLKSAGTIN